MKLTVTTPARIAVTADGVRHVRARDASGSFGILPGHADFVTALEVSVVSWRDAGGGEHHAAVRGGVLRVRGDEVDVATREAVVGDDLAELESTVVARLRRDFARESAARAAQLRFELGAMRLLVRYLDPRAERGEP